MLAVLIPFYVCLCLSHLPESPHRMVRQNFVRLEQATERHRRDDALNEAVAAAKDRRLKAVHRAFNLRHVFVS